MFRYCSSVAFIAMLTFGCTSKKTGDGDDFGTGGSVYNATGGAESIIGGGNGGDSSGIENNRNMPVITQEEWDQINEDSCSGWTAEGEMVPAMIYFIVDTSGSMRDVSDNTTDGRSKWAITSTALKEALNTLPRLTSVGMLLWPNQMTVPNSYTDALPCAYCDDQGNPDPRGPAMCVNTSAMVPLDKLGALGSDHRNWLAQTLDAVDPQGGTPMADAYNYAITKNFGDALMLGKKYAVLITDGQPTIQLGCMGTGEEKRPVDYTPVLQSVSGALTNAPYVKTFVIGSPGSEKQSLTGDDGRGWLSEAARSGDTKLTDDCKDSGSPNYCHFDMSAADDFATGFSAALKNITGQVLSCTFQINETSLEGQKVNPDKVNVVYQENGSSEMGDMRLVGKATTSDCPDDNGWYIENPDDPNNKTIQLCPATCARIQQDAGAVVNIRGGCDTLVVIN